MDGTNFGYLVEDNASIQPTTRMTILKIGVNF